MDISIDDDEHPINLIDLCDDALFKIFSYLNCDDAIRLSLVCKRFWYFIEQNKCPVSAASTTEWATLKSMPKRCFNYDRFFDKIGSHLQKFTIDSNEDGFEMNLIMKSIGKYCHNVKTMIVFHLLYANVVKNLPKSLRCLIVGGYRAKCLNISQLTHLEKLSLVTSDALNDLKVHRPLKEFHLEIQQRFYMPALDHVKINRLTTMVSSEIFDVKCYGHGRQTIVLDEWNRINNLKLFQLRSFFIIEGINPTNMLSSQMLCNCGNYVHLSMDTSHTILTNFTGQDFPPYPVTKVVRYIPRKNLTIEFEYDDYIDRIRYFEPLNLGLPDCHCASVEVRILFQ